MKQEGEGESITSIFISLIMIFFSCKNSFKVWFWLTKLSWYLKITLFLLMLFLEAKSAHISSILSSLKHSILYKVPKYAKMIYTNSFGTTFIKISFFEFA